MASTYDQIDHDPAIFYIENLEYYIGNVKSAKEGLSTAVEWMAKPDVTHRQFLQVKKAAIDLDKTIEELQNVRNQLKVLIDATEPYNEPLKIV